MGKFGSLGLNVSTGVRMPILNPKTLEPITDKDGTEAYLELMSPDGEKGAELDRKQTERAIERQIRRSQSPRKTAEAVAELIDANVDKIVKLLTGWYLVDLDGRHLDVPFTEENAREFFSDPELKWIRRQALAFIDDIANFTKASSVN